MARSARCSACPICFPSLSAAASIVLPDPLAVGPHSVGYRLTKAALVFGRRTITATDCAVAAGIAEIGDKALAKVPPALAALNVFAETSAGRNNSAPASGDAMAEAFR